MVEGRLVEAENQEALDTDACHSSWRVGDAIVKCYRRLWRGAHPEPELGAR